MVLWWVRGQLSALSHYVRFMGWAGEENAWMQDFCQFPPFFSAQWPELSGKVNNSSIWTRAEEGDRNSV